MTVRKRRHGRRLSNECVGVTGGATEGGCSTVRSFARPVSVAEELKRVLRWF